MSDTPDDKQSKRSKKIEDQANTDRSASSRRSGKIEAKAEGARLERRESDKRATTLEALVAGLATEVRLMNSNLGELSARIDRRPTRQESSYRRRLTVFGIVLLILGTMQLTDLHTEACGPGHRAEAIVGALARGNIHNIDELNKVGKDATPGWWCGLTFPTHTHDGQSWPETQHVAGLITYAGAVLALGWWTIVPYRRSRAQEDR